MIDEPLNLYKKGVNLGGWFSHLLPNTQINSHLSNFIKKKDLEDLAKAGFDHVRLPIDWQILSESTLPMLEKAVSLISSHNLKIQLNLHYSPGLEHQGPQIIESKLFHSESIQDQFFEIWKNLLSRLENIPGLAYEPINEPWCEKNQTFNQFQHHIVKTFRNFTKSPLILSSNHFASVHSFSSLEPVSDQNVFYAFHFYSPLSFTHQKANWIHGVDVSETVDYPGQVQKPIQNPIGKKELGNWDMTRLESELKSALDFRNKYQVNIICNEFGVYEKAPLQSRVNWLKDTLSIFKKHHIPYTYWNYKECGFSYIESKQIQALFTEM